MTLLDVVAPGRSRVGTATECVRQRVQEVALLRQLAHLERSLILQREHHRGITSSLDQAPSRPYFTLSRNVKHVASVRSATLESSRAFSRDGLTSRAMFESSRMSASAARIELQGTYAARSFAYLQDGIGTSLAGSSGTQRLSTSGPGWAEANRSVPSQAVRASPRGVLPCLQQSEVKLDGEFIFEDENFRRAFKCIKNVVAKSHTLEQVFRRCDVKVRMSRFDVVCLLQALKHAKNLNIRR